MSRAYGLVKFNRTNNIYWCCYNGTTDIMIPFLFTLEEITNEKGYRCPITKADEMKSIPWTTEGIEDADIDDIEIYSDYGCGFWWKGKGSENHKMIVKGINTYDEEIEEYDGTPQWVTNYISKINNE